LEKEESEKEDGLLPAKVLNRVMKEGTRSKKSTGFPHTNASESTEKSGFRRAHPLREQKEEKGIGKGEHSPSKFYV